MKFQSSPRRGSRSMLKSLRRSRPWMRFALATGTLFTFWILFRSMISGGAHSSVQVAELPGATPLKPSGPPLACSQLPGANDTVVVFKTSSAELEAHLPTHVQTTLRCYPNHLIFSDMAENYEGHRILDALASVDSQFRSKSADFDVWRRLQMGGPNVLTDDEYNNAAMPGSLVQRLDKWKMLPMLDRTLQEHPDGKWYVFVEADTHLVWSNLLAWLATLDHTGKYYLGSQLRLGDAVFADSGPGLVLSQAALQAVVGLFRGQKSRWEDFTARQERGDYVLGTALAEVGVKLTSAWPILQGTRISEIDYSQKSLQDGKRLWCYPTVSYHRMTPSEVAEMWKFEQEWIQRNTKDVLRHRNVFYEYFLPRLVVRSGRVDHWDNLSGDFNDGLPAESIHDCQGHCLADPDCVQFAFSEGTCVTSKIPKMGHRKAEASSRWLLAMSKRFGDNLDACTGNELWIND